MLFSATMTEKVSQLMKLSLIDPVKLDIDQMYHTSQRLHQEFIRIRKENQENQEAILLGFNLIILLTVKLFAKEHINRDL